MTSIPEPQGTHKVFESDDEQEMQKLGSLTVADEAVAQSKIDGHPTEQQAATQGILHSTSAILDSIAEDVAKHTVAQPSQQDLNGRYKKNASEAASQCSSCIDYGFFDF